VSLGDVALHLAMLQNFSPNTIQSLSGPLWTMPLDAQFYLVLPLGFAVAARCLRDREQHVRIAALVGALGVLIFLSVAYRFVAVWHWSPVGLDDQLFIVDQFPGMAGLFALGIAARLATMLVERGIWKIPPGATTAFALVAAAIAFRGAQYGAHAAWLHLVSGSGHMKPAAFAAFDEVLGGFGCACLLIAANFAPTGWFGRLVSSPAVAFAASISYGIYLFHYTVITSLRERLHGDGLATMIVLTAVGLVILVPLCSVTYFAIEKVFLERKARLKRLRDPAHPAG